jgi:ASC-1-like (ASCH) protein
MRYEMRLNNLPFKQFREGSKTTEVRLNDKKRSKLKIGDTIRFANRDNQDEFINTKVVGVYSAKTFDKLFDMFPAQEFGGFNKDELLKSIYQYYSAEDEQKFGVLGIKVKLYE